MAARTRITFTRVASPRKVAEELLEPMTNFGNNVAKRMQRLVPKRTWALHDSIQSNTEVVGSKVETEIGFGNDEVDYGLYLEYGTSRMEPQPFARPAFLQSRSSDFNGAGGPSEHGVTEYVDYTNARGETTRVTRKQAENYNRRKNNGGSSGGGS